MVVLNPAFPVFKRSQLQKSPVDIANALIEKGVCYISDYEDRLEELENEFNLLGLEANGEVRIISPKEARSGFPGIYSTLYTPEFKMIKRKVLGAFYKNEIEIFCQHTGPSAEPPSGVLHFDKRFTFKSWYYLNDIGAEQGAMRVVPLDKCEGDASPVELRKSYGNKKLFQGRRNKHQVSGEAKQRIEEMSEYVTGPAGTLFLHITEAWHGASPVSTDSERKILRAHSRAFSDYFLRG